MLRRISLIVMFLVILGMPVYAHDHCAPEHHKDCSMDCPAACPGCPGDKNPLDVRAKKFIEDDVMKIAVLPFSDYSITSPIKSTSYLYWASRRIHDFITAEFLSIGKLVVPYDTMFAALDEVRGGVDIHGKDIAGGYGQLARQVLDMGVSVEGTEIVMGYMRGSSGRGIDTMTTPIIALDLTSSEIIALGEALGVDAIFMGSISDYGRYRRIKDDARTFIPPFLGLWNPSEKTQVRMLIYLYETKTGELIWASMEEVEYEPRFPLFSTLTKNYEKLNKQLARDIVDHFRDKPDEIEDDYEVVERTTWGPGDTRKEKDLRKVIRGEY